MEDLYVIALEKQMRKVLSVLFLLTFVCSFMFSAAVAEADGRIKIKVLILPKFEIGEMSGDAPGEAQFFYDGFLAGGDEYDIIGGVEGHKMYVKDGVALYVVGMGKVNAAASTLSVLLDGTL